MSATLFNGPGETARLVALCAHGAEPLCAAELGEIPGASAVAIARGAVTFRATREGLYRANLSLRTPSRVLCPLSDWPCGGERDLYDQARELPWEAYLSARGTLSVNAHGQLPGLSNSMFSALRVKDAICDRLRERRGARPDVNPEDPDLSVNVQLYLEGGQPRSAIALDSSSPPLHRRGYRSDGGKAPLKETLAATIVLLSGYRQGTLVDLCCGSGTLLLEGGLLALHRAPGIQRRFAFQRWPDFDGALWERLRSEARARARPTFPQRPFLHGSDIDDGALLSTGRAAKTAGIERALRLGRADLCDAAPPPGEPGLVLCNPPYGERLGDEEALRGLYRALGDTLKRRFAGYHACVFTANLRLGKEIGLKPKKKDILFNGPLEGRLLHFALY